MGVGSRNAAPTFTRHSRREFHVSEFVAVGEDPRPTLASEGPECDWTSQTLGPRPGPLDVNGSPLRRRAIHPPGGEVRDYLRPSSTCTHGCSPKGVATGSLLTGSDGGGTRVGHGPLIVRSRRPPPWSAGARYVEGSLTAHLSRLAATHRGTSGEAGDRTGSSTSRSKGSSKGPARGNRWEGRVKGGHRENLNRDRDGPTHWNPFNDLERHQEGGRH